MLGFCWNLVGFNGFRVPDESASHRNSVRTAHNVPAGATNRSRRFWEALPPFQDRNSHFCEKSDQFSELAWGTSYLHPTYIRESKFMPCPHQTRAQKSICFSYFLKPYWQKFIYLIIKSQTEPRPSRWILSRKINCTVMFAWNPSSRHYSKWYTSPEAGFV